MKKKGYGNKVEEEKKCLTTSHGNLIEDDENSKTIGNDGPVLLEDIGLLDKIAQFDRERIPERVVHAKGAGAHGYFKCYKSMKKYTSADFLSEDNKKTPVFVRFSTVIGGRGSADTVRDPRGFSVKFYTDEGNYDIVGNDIPQAGERYRSLCEKDRCALVDNILSELWEVPESIQNKVIEYFFKADKEFGSRVKNGLKK